MRIGLFAHRLAERQPTGLSRYLRELVPALRRATWDGELVLVSAPDPEPVAWATDTVAVHRLRWPRGALQLAWCLDAGPAIERSVGELDVTHLVQPFPPARSRSPQVVTVHDLFPLEHPEWYPRSERWTFRRSIELGLRRARRVVVPSRYVADRVTSSFAIDPERVHVVPHGVSGRFSRRVADDKVAATCHRFGVEPGGYVVCVGAVSQRKNVRTLIRAMALGTTSSCAAVIVGPDGDGVELIEDEMRRHRGPAPVFRTGFLPDESTAALVQGARALVHPALAEGFGLVPLEAMAVGTPVIAARSASVPEVVGKAGILIDDPSDPRAWADALALLGEDDEHRRRLAAAGAERAATFSWERAAMALLDIYARTVRD